MHKIIYVQSNEEIAETFRERFLEDDIEMINAKTGEEALEIIGREKVLLLLIDINIPDMRLRKFVDKVREQHPQVILTVCVDVLDPLMITKLSNRHHMHKIYVAPWDVDEIVEGVKESLEIALINEETNIREETISSEKAELEETLERLKNTLKKQQHSFSKLNALTACFTNALKEKEQTDSTTIRKIQFAREAFKTMLVLQTTGSFDVEKFELYIRKDLEQIKEIAKGYETKEISSCLLGGQSRTKAQNIRFSIYLIAKLYAQFYDDFSIDVSSHYLTTQEAEFCINVTINGEKTRGSDEEMKEYYRYVNDLITVLATSYRETINTDEENEKKHTISYFCSFIVSKD